MWFYLNYGNEMKICDLKTACNFSLENIGN